MRLFIFFFIEKRAPNGNPDRLLSFQRRCSISHLSGSIWKRAVSAMSDHKERGRVLDELV